MSHTNITIGFMLKMNSLSPTPIKETVSIIQDIKLYENRNIVYALFHWIIGKAQLYNKNGERFFYNVKNTQAYFKAVHPDQKSTPSRKELQNIIFDLIEQKNKKIEAIQISIEIDNTSLVYFPLIEKSDNDDIETLSLNQYNHLVALLRESNIPIIDTYDSEKNILSINGITVALSQKEKIYLSHNALKIAALHGIVQNEKLDISLIKNEAYPKISVLVTEIENLALEEKNRELIESRDSVLRTIFLDSKNSFDISKDRFKQDDKTIFLTLGLPIEIYQQISTDTEIYLSEEDVEELKRYSLFSMKESDFTIEEKIENDEI